MGYVHFGGIPNNTLTYIGSCNLDSRLCWGCELTSVRSNNIYMNMTRTNIIVHSDIYDILVSEDMYYSIVNTFFLEELKKEICINVKVGASHLECSPEIYNNEKPITFTIGHFELTLKAASYFIK